MIPGMMVKTGCKKGFDPSGQRTLPTDEPDRLPSCRVFLVCIQWGWGSEGVALNLPLSAALLSIVGMHEGSTKQTVTYSTNQKKWIGDDSSLSLLYIALCK